MSLIEADNIDKLYKNYDILSDAKETISEHEKEYREIIEAFKGSDKEKHLEYMPLPPVIDGESAIEENPSFKFSHAECLLYALHKLGKQSVEYFQFKDDPAKLKEFQSRLQYLEHGAQGCIKKLQETVNGKAPRKGDDEAATNGYHIKIIALKTIPNISTLIRDLFHNPPIFRSLVQLSWVTKKINDSRGGKRHVPTTLQSDADNDAKRLRRAKSTTSSFDLTNAPILPTVDAPEGEAPFETIIQELSQVIEELGNRIKVLEEKAKSCRCGAMQ